MLASEASTCHSMGEISFPTLPSIRIFENIARGNRCSRRACRSTSRRKRRDRRGSADSNSLYAVPNRVRPARIFAGISPSLLHWIEEDLGCSEVGENEWLTDP